MNGYVANECKMFDSNGRAVGYQGGGGGQCSFFKVYSV